MNCANPACGHDVLEHVPTTTGESGFCWTTRALKCTCVRFVPPTPSREPLMAQLEAVIRTRR